MGGNNRGHGHFSLRPRIWEEMEHITSNLGVGGSNPSERASSRPAGFDIPAVGDTGRFQAGGTRGTQIDGALLKRKRIGRQELAQWASTRPDPKTLSPSEANVSRPSHPPAAAKPSGEAIVSHQPRPTEAAKRISRVSELTTDKPQSRQPRPMRRL